MKLPATTICVLGYAQASLIWAVGKHFNRTTSAKLYSYDRDGIRITFIPSVVTLISLLYKGWEKWEEPYE
jgi:hypothetical protein